MGYIKPIDRCIYCNSASYGWGCKHSANKLHFHATDSTKCSYCGSTSYGKGCRYSPDGIHIHGINYNQMLTDSIDENINNGILLNFLRKKITDYKAYKLGIIDESGNKIKEPITEQERASYTPSIRTILKIKRYLGSKLQLMEEIMNLKARSNLDYCAENHKKVLSYEDKFNEIYAMFHETVHQAQEDGLTFEQIESLINKNA